MNKNKYLSSFNHRRKLLAAGASLPAMTWPCMAYAQAKPPMVIGWLAAGKRESDPYQINAFNEGMAERGWKLGAQYVLEERWLDGHMELLRATTEDLATKKPGVIVVSTFAVAVAMTKAAPNTPIVLRSGSPVESGLVKSLARPGGMVTGITNFGPELIGKHVELLLEAAPRIRRIGFLINPTTLAIAAHRDMIQNAAKRFSIEVRLGEASKQEELDAALNRMAKDGAQAIVLAPGIWFGNARHRIMQFALAHRMPVVAGSFTFAEAGALISYGGDARAQLRRIPYFVDRILKGAKPADLPIEQPTVFELVVNMKTAKALGITFPPSIMVRVTRVIE